MFCAFVPLAAQVARNKCFYNGIPFFTGMTSASLVHIAAAADGKHLNRQYIFPNGIQYTV